MLLPKLAPVCVSCLKLLTCPSNKPDNIVSPGIGRCFVKSDNCCPPKANSVANPGIAPTTAPRPDIRELSTPPVILANLPPKLSTSSLAFLVFLANSLEALLASLLGPPPPALPVCPVGVLPPNALSISLRVLSEAAFSAVTSPTPGISIFTAIY